MYISKIRFLKPCFNESVIHSQIYASFPAQIGRILYRKETNIENNKLNVYAIVFSEKKPFSTKNVEIVVCREIQPVFHENETFEFEIKLVPEYTMYGKRLPQKNTKKRIEFLERKLETNGAVLLSEVKESSKEVLRVKHETGIQQITSYTYTGKIMVTNSEMFKRAYKKGIGHCKAYGCGMLLLKR